MVTASLPCASFSL